MGSSFKGTQKKYIYIYFLRGEGDIKAFLGQLFQTVAQVSPLMAT